MGTINITGRISTIDYAYLEKQAVYTGNSSWILITDLMNFIRA